MKEIGIMLKLTVLIGIISLSIAFLKAPSFGQFAQTKLLDSESILADFPIQTDSGEIIIHRFFPKDWQIDQEQISGPDGVLISENPYSDHAFAYNQETERIEGLVENYLNEAALSEGWKPVQLVELPLIQSSLEHVADQINPENSIRFQTWVYGLKYQDSLGTLGFRLFYFKNTGDFFYHSVAVRTVDIRAGSDVLSKTVEAYLRGLEQQYIGKEFLAHLALERFGIRKTLNEWRQIQGWRQQMVVRSPEEKARLYAKERAIRNELNSFRTFSMKYLDWY